MRSPSIFTLIFFALLPFTTFGRETTDSIPEIMAQQQIIREGILTVSGRYADMPKIKRSKILAEQDKLFPLFEGKTKVSELNTTQMTEAFNALEVINAAVNNKEDERIFCNRVKKTGSNQVTRICKSIAEIRAEHEDGQAGMRTGQVGCNTPDCGDMKGLPGR